jgi:hypothetical protein
MEFFQSERRSYLFYLGSETETNKIFPHKKNFFFQEDGDTKSSEQNKITLLSPELNLAVNHIQ